MQAPKLIAMMLFVECGIQSILRVHVPIPYVSTFAQELRCRDVAIPSRTVMYYVGTWTVRQIKGSPVGMLACSALHRRTL